MPYWTSANERTVRKFLRRRYRLHRNCAECSSPDACQRCLPGEQCELTCEEPTPITDLYRTNSCVSKCPVGAARYENNDGATCLYCSEGCQDCQVQGEKVRCLDCSDGFTQEGYSCVAEEVER